MKVLERVKLLFADLSKMISAANICDKAYAESIRNMSCYKPFDESDPVKIAQNLAALPAVINGVCIINKKRNEIQSIYTHHLPKEEFTIEENFIKILEEIEDDCLAESELEILLQLANTTWNAQQPFRGLDRIGRMNVFDLLSDEEKMIDLYQIKAAAMFLLEELFHATGQ